MKLLALDGGGVFGIGQAGVLAAAGDAALKGFDMVAGTSIGAAVGAWTVYGMPTGMLPSFFHAWMPKIFGTRNWPSWGWRMHGARYKDDGINDALMRTLTMRFGEADRPFFACAVNGAVRRLKVFDSTDHEDGQWGAWEVVRASTAAPTYFPPWRGYYDGGVMVNDPEMVLIIESLRRGAKLSDIELFSIGCGREFVGEITPPDSSTGALAYGVTILETLLQGASTMHETAASTLPIRRHLRVQFQRGRHWEMDNPSDMRIAERVWAPQVAAAATLLKEF